MKVFVTETPKEEITDKLFVILMMTRSVRRSILSLQYSTNTWASSLFCSSSHPRHFLWGKENDCKRNSRCG